MEQETKLICTIGPASDSSSILLKMAKSGMNVVRLNFSHGNHTSHAKIIDKIREINRKYKYSIQILQDLEGQRIRIGHLESEVRVKKKDIIHLSTKKKNIKENILPFDYSGIVENIPLKKELFIDDGRLRFKIIDRYIDGIILKTIQGGTIFSRKGINIPYLTLTNKTLSKKDQNDIDFGIKNKVDIVAQSFVTTEQDIELVNKMIKPSENSICKIFAKIENRSGISNINSIIKSCDGIMVARGDLGISLPIYKVPVIQKYILNRCNRLKKEAIIATQMLESMTTSPYPTRAEVSDVANAIFDKTDYVMLSGETASGKFPVHSVKMIKKIIKYTEKSLNIYPI